MKTKEYRIAINMGYAQQFWPNYLEKADSHHDAAMDALRRYFGPAMVEQRFSDLVPLTKRHAAPDRRVFQVLTVVWHLRNAEDADMYEKAFDIIVDEVTNG